MVIYRKLHIYLLAFCITVFVFCCMHFLVFNRSEKQENNIVVQEQNDEIREEAKILCNFYKSNPWRISIPSLDVDAPIEEGTESEVLRRCVGHLKKSGYTSGNIVLAAHNRGYKCNYFQDINKLQNGDVIIYSKDDQIKRFIVEVNKEIKETDFRDVENTQDNRITLITCISNNKDARTCIIAKEEKKYDKL